MDEALRVLVPDEQGGTALEQLDGVRAVRYDPAEPLPLPPEARDAEVLVVPPAYAGRLLAAMREMPRLRLVQTLSAGTDRWEGNLPDGVALSNARGAHGGSTAEWAAAVLLAIYRELPRFAADQAAGLWRHSTTDTLDGKRVLILGAGDLGASLRARLEPFGARITMVGRRSRPGIQAAGDLPALLPRHDAVVVMVPYNDSTRHMVGASFLAAMPDGAVLVNAARGPIVDTGALLAELRSGRLRAALDVTDPEPLPAGHPLWHAPGVLITPHVGGNTAGAAERAWAVAARQIAQYASGKQPDNLITGAS
jgi:phosphoglycerate dehydrogenase-like enzyme